MFNVTSDFIGVIVVLLVELKVKVFGGYFLEARVIHGRKVVHSGIEESYAVIQSCL